MSKDIASDDEDENPFDPKAGRIVNIGSNGGPEFVSTITDLTVKKQVHN